ncbi:glutathione S-transferase family protein [Mangrovicella endophytica]|uniref:glutathione S-transferase family protein n=1 Tax=Mangrovicella endophytica TaxID=2066697 RepID=UPI000C9DF178|nr:glutathione S-transferase family protein [Mangrovicella endophytica]
MILIGQYDSPFVRRVGIALTLYELPFEHRPWSTFGDAEKIRPYNPLLRVPTLVLDDGDVLIDSHLVLDHVDGRVSADRRLYPTEEPQRHRAQNVVALAAGISDKAVSLFYELYLHEQRSELWVERCRSQIIGALAVLETSRADQPSDYWFGTRIGHADIAVATTLRHLTEAHPGLVDMDRLPALRSHAARMEALPVFEAVSQRFIPPSG